MADIKHSLAENSGNEWYSWIIMLNIVTTLKYILRFLLILAYILEKSGYLDSLYLGFRSGLGIETEFC